VDPFTATPPRWARFASLALAVASIATFIIGRGGTVMLATVALAFGAIAVLLLTMPDRLPNDEGDPDQSH
jgi:hypothetical protein